jgi:phytoene desaturase
MMRPLLQKERDMGNTHHAPTAVVIGSGIGGLAAAIRLGARGYRVTIFENRDRAGGRAYCLERDGYVFDMGPTVVTAPQMFEELWQICGKRMSDTIDLRSVEPFYAVRFHDGTAFDYTGDEEAMLAQVEELTADDIRGYRDFIQMSEKIFHIGFERLSDVPFSSIWSMVKIAPSMIRLKSYKTVYDLIASYIKNEKLRQLLSFHTLLVGGNPFTTTSIYALVAYLEQKWGVHFPIGGMGALVQGMVSLVDATGGTIHYSSEVKKIEVEDGKAVGVRLSDGSVTPADIVVSNADVAWTYRKLLDPGVRKRWTNRKIDKMKYSMSLFVWYFGTQKQYPHVKHHSILLGPRYKELLADIFENKVLAEDFSLYLHRPTATDPALAPEGHDAFYVLSPVPHLEADIDWATQAEPYRASIEKYLENTVLPGLHDAIDVSFVMTPQHFRDELLSVNGAGFAMQPVLTQSAYFRPHNESEEIEGLYIVGAGTHPGAGLPGVLSSAKILDRIIPDARSAA